MLFKLLSTVIFWYKKFVTYPDYYIVSEEIEYKIDYRMKYKIEDDFWLLESKDWDGVLDEFHVVATGKNFRNTIIPQNVKHLILRVKYWYNGKIYKAISTNINFKPCDNQDIDMRFTIPLSSAWIVDRDDKPQINITEKIKRYSGPMNDFHGESVPLKDFLYYTAETLKKHYPKIILTNTIGMKKTVLTQDESTINLRIP